jgi:hypothetical protein
MMIGKAPIIDRGISATARYLFYTYHVFPMHTIYIYYNIYTPPTRAYLELFFVVFAKKTLVLLSSFLCALYTTISLGVWFLRINPNYIIQTNLIHFASKTFLLKNPWRCSILLFRREAFRDVKLYFW